MKNKDKLTLIVFIILIILIMGIFIYYLNSNKTNGNIDRKVNYLFDNITYDMAYINGKDLFNKGIKLLTNKDVFIYEKDYNGRNAYFSVDNCMHCKKIQNPMAFTNILTKDEIEIYMKNNNIFKYENLYYTDFEFDYSYNKKYIGSMLDIVSYDKEYVYFNSKNYYCDNSNYIGLLDKEPDCKYNIKETKFTIKYENNGLRLNDLNEIKNIVK